jgi:hypothetical protein
VRYRLRPSAFPERRGDRHASEIYITIERRRILRDGIAVGAAKNRMLNLFSPGDLT